MGGLPTNRREQYRTDLSLARGASSERQDTTIDRFYEREPDLSVSDVLAALDEVSMALACKRARTHWSRANVVRMSDYRHSI